MKMYIVRPFGRWIFAALLCRIPYAAALLWYEYDTECYPPEHEWAISTSLGSIVIFRQ